MNPDVLSELDIYIRKEIKEKIIIYKKKSEYIISRICNEMRVRLYEI